MIFTKVCINNLYSFKDFELDLTYPRKSNNSLLDGESLNFAPSFKFKKICILLGTNASGKTSFGKVLWFIQHYIHNFGRAKPLLLSYIAEGVCNKEENAKISVEFVLTESQTFHALDLIIAPTGNIKVFSSVYVNIKPNDTNTTARKRLLAKKDKPEQVSDLRDSDLNGIRDICELNMWYYYVFTENDSPELNLTSILSEKDLGNVLAVLKTFDPSIIDVKPLYTRIGEGEEDVFEGYTVVFDNEDTVMVTNDGQTFGTRKKNRFSKGTYDALSIADFFVSVVNSAQSDKSYTFFLDEKLASSHTELEISLLNLMISKLNAYSQLFYTTHNHDVLDMYLPNHSFTFLHKDNDTTIVEQPEKMGFVQNDRKLKGNVRSNYFGTEPSTFLLDTLWD